MVDRRIWFGIFGDNIDSIFYSRLPEKLLNVLMVNVFQSESVQGDSQTVVDQLNTSWMKDFRGMEFNSDSIQ